MGNAELDAARRAALDEARRSERSARNFVIAGGVMELAIFVAIMVVMDFESSTHLLIFFCACLAYVPIVFALFALKSYIDLSTRRVLTGIQFGRGD